MIDFLLLWIILLLGVVRSGKNSRPVNDDAKTFACSRLWNRSRSDGMFLPDRTEYDAILIKADEWISGTLAGIKAETEVVSTDADTFRGTFVFKDDLPTPNGDDALLLKLQESTALMMNFFAQDGLFGRIYMIRPFWYGMKQSVETLINRPHKSLLVYNIIEEIVVMIEGLRVSALYKRLAYSGMERLETYFERNQDFPWYERMIHENMTEAERKFKQFMVDINLSRLMRKYSRLGKSVNQKDLLVMIEYEAEEKFEQLRQSLPNYKLAKTVALSFNDIDEVMKMLMSTIDSMSLNELQNFEDHIGSVIGRLRVIIKDLRKTSNLALTTEWEFEEIVYLLKLYSIMYPLIKNNTEYLDELQAWRNGLRDSCWKIAKNFRSSFVKNGERRVKENGNIVGKLANHAARVLSLSQTFSGFLFINFLKTKDNDASFHNFFNLMNVLSHLKKSDEDHANIVLDEMMALLEISDVIYSEQLVKQIREEMEFLSPKKLRENDYIENSTLKIATPSMAVDHLERSETIDDEAADIDISLPIPTVNQEINFSSEPFKKYNTSYNVAQLTDKKSAQICEELDGLPSSGRFLESDSSAIVLAMTDMRTLCQVQAKIRGSANLPWRSVYNLLMKLGAEIKFMGGSKLNIRIPGRMRGYPVRIDRPHGSNKIGRKFALMFGKALRDVWAIDAGDFVFQV